VIELPQDLKNWDSLSAVPTFDFFFKVNVPKPRKGREIVERDGLGRIVSARVFDTKITYL